MARALRIEYPGAVYHVMSRGDHGEAIWRDDQDRQQFLKCLEEACGKTGWLVHAWVLMGNHYHLLLETPESNLVAGMKWLQGTYTSRFNARHKVRGHLFQGRYKALNVDATQEDYFQVVSSYIHLNPVRAKLVKAGEEPLSNYPWSSYPVYLAPTRKRPKWLRTDRVLESVGIHPADRRASIGYKAYMEGRALECNQKKPRQELEEEWRRIRRGWYLGDRKFKQRLIDWMDRNKESRKRQSVAGPAVRAREEVDAQEWLKRGLAAVGLKEADLAKLPKGHSEKQVVAWWLRRHTILDRRWIAGRLSMGHENRVTLAVREVERTTRGALAKKKKVIEKLALELEQPKDE